MLRKIFLVLLLAGFVGLSFFFFQKFNEKKVVEQDHFLPVPNHSVWVLDTRDPSTLLATLKGTNIIYDQLKQDSILPFWFSYLEKLDSLYKTFPTPNKEKENHRLVMSLVPSGAESYHALLSTEVSGINIEEWSKLIKPFGTLHPDNHKVYDGANILTLSLKSGQNAFFSYYKNFALFSKSQMVIEDAVRQLNSGHSLLQQPDFKKVTETAGNSRKLNCYIQQKQLVKYLAQYFDPTFSSNTLIEQGMANWMELDLWLKPNSLMFNGYGVASTKNDEFLSVFKNQNAGSLNLPELLPINTSFFISYNLSSFHEYSKNYLNYLSTTNRIDSYKKHLKALNDSAGLNTQELLTKTLGSEIGLAVLELNGDVSDQSLSAIYQKTLVLARLKDADAWLDNVVKLIKPSGGDNLYVSEYREVKTYEMNVVGLMAQNVSGLFGGLKNRYFVVLDDYVIFAENEAVLRDAINAYKSEKTLSEDDNYQNFSENMSSNANVSVYASIARSPHLFGFFLKQKHQKWLLNKIELMRKFEGLAIQISPEEDLYYYNVYLKYNPIYKKVTSSLWEINLDSGISTAPVLFQNHYTKAGEVLIQDNSNTLYLISNTGRKLWSKKLNGRVISKFYKVDKFKNNKFQILCNTQNSVYLIDRNGKDVSGFPITPKQSLAPLSLLDYDNNRKYRIWLPNSSGTIACYDINGKKVKGWKQPKGLVFNSELKYSSINRKDYIIGVSTDGSVRAYNRKGEVRIKFKEKMPLAKASKFYLEPGKSLKESNIIGMDSAGNILRLSYSGKLEVLQLDNSQDISTFNYTDIDRDKKADYVFQGSEGVQAFNASSELILSIENESELSSGIGVFSSNVMTYLAVASSKSDQVWLYNQLGKEQEGNPFLGSNKPLIADINLDGHLELITTSKEGVVYCYTLN